MPVIQYFVFAGGLLLSLLFAADHHLTRAVAPSTAAEVDRSIIRIGSTRPLPEKIVFDVSHPPAPTAMPGADVARDEQSPQYERVGGPAAPRISMRAGISKQE